MKFAEFLKVANWPMIVYMSLVHIMGIWGAMLLTSAMWQTLAWACIAYWFGGVGITGGAHRLWAHRSYSAHWTVRLLLMLCNSMASQGTIYHWSRDHRLHHKFSETSKDPHNATRGFFYSHIGWLLVKKDPEVIKAGQVINLDDLQNDPIVMFQKKFDPWWNLFWCFFFPAIVAKLFWDESFLTGILICGSLRYMLLLHATWTVNSLAHQYGNRPYDSGINPRENRWVSIWAIGEGWHNWHHRYPWDYATSEFGVGKRFNPTKFFIDSLAYLGLVWDRKRALEAWKLAKAKIGQQTKSINDTAVHLQSATAL